MTRYPGPRADRDGDTEHNKRRAICPFSMMTHIIVAIACVLVGWLCARAAADLAWKDGMQTGFALGFVTRGDFPL